MVKQLLLGLATFFMIGLYNMHTTNANQCHDEIMLHQLAEEYRFEIGWNLPEFIDQEVRTNLVVSTSCEANVTAYISIDWGLVQPEVEGYYPITITVLYKNKVKTFTSYIDVKYDLTKPEIIGIQNPLYVEINSEVDFLTGITVIDNKDATPQVIVYDQEVDMTTIGSYPLIYQAMDASGNVTEELIEVIVQDTTKPVLKGVKDIVVQYERNMNLANFDFFHQVEVYDNSLKPVIKWVNYEGVNPNQLGEYEVIYIAIDESGNKTEVKQKFTIVDQIKPSIKILRPIVYEIGQGYMDYRNFIAVSDNYDDLSFDDLIIVDDGVNYEVPGVYYVNLFCMDSNQNFTYESIPVTVISRSHPKIIASNREITVFSEINLLENVLAFDEIDGDLSEKITVIDKELKVNAIGTYTVYYFVCNRSGNCTTEAITIKVVDNQSPIINGIKDLKVEVFSQKIDLLAGISVIDDYDGDLLSELIIEHEIDLQRLGDYLVTYRVKDSSGNETVITRVVSVVDTIKPVLKNVKDVKTTKGDIVNLLQDVIATDNYDGDLTAKIVLKGEYDFKTPGTYELKVEVMDSSGNLSFEYFKLIVEEKRHHSFLNLHPLLSVLMIEEKTLYVMGFMVAVVLFGIIYRLFKMKGAKSRK